MLSNLPLFIEFIIVPPQILYPTHHDIHRQSSLTINRLFRRRRRPHSPQVEEEGRCRLEIAYLEVFVVAVAGCYFFRFFLISCYYSKPILMLILIPTLLQVTRHQRTNRVPRHKRDRAPPRNRIQ